MPRYANVDRLMGHAIKMDWSMLKWVNEVDIYDAINPNVVERAVYNQVKVERDIAIDQLRSINKGLGAEMDDVVVQKKGKWIDKPVYKQTMDGKTWDGFTYCSECKEKYEYGYRSKFCPNCGSDMRGEEDA